MEKIRINCRNPYDVYVGKDILKNLGDLVAKNYTEIALVTDENVEKYYGEICLKSLKNKGFNPLKYVIKPGEGSKNTDEYIKLLNFLGENEFDRNSLLIALGGGVVGDLTGFAAATYMRGISFAQVPTSFLAMVDSSVGGKTAVNLKCGKNSVGAFYQPDFVLCDVNCLKTLPDYYMKDGLGEVIKYGILDNAELFEKLNYPLPEDKTEIISACIKIKNKIVSKDEFDKGIRQLLNLGHTIAHGLEKLSGYTISHGCAVATGIYAISKIAFQNSICSEETFVKIENILKFHGFNLEIPYTYKEIFDTIKHDKKKNGESINVVFPKKIGLCGIYTLTFDKFREMLLFSEEK